MSQTGSNSQHFNEKNQWNPGDTILSLISGPGCFNLAIEIVFVLSFLLKETMNSVLYLRIGISAEVTEVLDNDIYPDKIDRGRPWLTTNYHGQP